MHAPILLDGPMGTELLARGVATPLPGWSAHALETDPQTVASIHRDYATAGADVHTTNTFRTQPRHFPDSWRALIHTAVAMVRHGISTFEGRIAGSIAPLEDCYLPARSPTDPGPEHREVARALAEEGVDLMLVETFSHVGEAIVAATEAIETGVPTWVSFTAGPDADLLGLDEIRAGAERVVALGAEAVLINCIPTRRVAEFLTAISDLGVPFGGYGNAGDAQDEVGFTASPIACDDYVAAARDWVAVGAGILGSCCGTGVAHVRALRTAFPP